MHIARPQPVLLAMAALLLAASLGGGAIPGLLPLADPKPDVAQRARLAAATRCASCGVIDAIRTVEPRAGTQRAIWRVTVRLDDGSVRTLSQPAAPPFAIGDRVRIVNGSGLERA